MTFATRVSLPDTPPVPVAATWKPSTNDWTITFDQPISSIITTTPARVMWRSAAGVTSRAATVVKLGPRTIGGKRNAGATTALAGTIQIIIATGIFGALNGLEAPVFAGFPLTEI